MALRLLSSKFATQVSAGRAHCEGIRAVQRWGTGPGGVLSYILRTIVNYLYERFLQCMMACYVLIQARLLARGQQ